MAPAAVARGLSGCRCGGGRLGGRPLRVRARRSVAAGQTQLEIAAQLTIQPCGRQTTGEGCGLPDIPARSLFVPVQPVQQKAFVQRLGLAGEGRHDLVAAPDRIVEPIELDLREAVIRAETPLRKRFLGAGAEEKDCQKSDE